MTQKPLSEARELSKRWSVFFPSVQRAQRALQITSSLPTFEIKNKPEAIKYNFSHGEHLWRRQNTVTFSWLSFLQSKVNGLLKNSHLTLKLRRVVFCDWLRDAPKQLYPGDFHRPLRSCLCDSASHLCWKLRHPHTAGAGIPQTDTSPSSNLWTPESGTGIFWNYVVEGPSGHSLLY